MPFKMVNVNRKPTLAFLILKNSLAKANGNILLAEVRRHYTLNLHYLKPFSVYKALNSINSVLKNIMK